MTVDWMRVCGHALTRAERKFLHKSALDLEQVFAELVIVNIGVFRCASMYCLRSGAPRARLIGIDIKPCKVKIDPSLNAEFIIKDSRKCYQDFDSDIHLLFIDGDHHYPVVLADLNNWASKVVSGGVVILHDVSPLPKDLVKNPFIAGVRKAVTEWHRANQQSWTQLAAPDSLAAFRRNLMRKDLPT